MFLNFFYTLVIDVEKIVENMEKKLLRTNGKPENPMKIMAEIKIFQHNFEVSMFLFYPKINLNT